ATEADIPEAFRPEYVQGADGVWRCKADDELEVERKKRTDLLNEKKDEERRRKEAEQKLADAQRIADAKAKGVSEDELQRIRADLAAQYAPVEQEAATLRSEVRKLKLTDRVKAMSLKAGRIMADRIDDAMLVIEPRTELGDADGIVFKDAKGAVTAMTEEQFFAALKTEKPWLFEFTGGSGSGSTGSSRTTTTTPAAPSIDARKRASVMGAF
ncbi:hypothetical protein, partial [Gemmatimonas sp.]|uniref:hypothetical protein n=1 Tax=Gemmatimonas sp. TaxID=1962908 RepID=UPI0033419EFD